MRNEKETIERILEDCKLEYERASGMFPQFNSPHEGYAILLEEVDELWDEIKGNKKEGALERMRKEAVQVAAMAMRFIELIDYTNDAVDDYIHSLESEYATEYESLNNAEKF